MKTWITEIRIKGKRYAGPRFYETSRAAAERTVRTILRKLHPGIRLVGEYVGEKKVRAKR